MGAVSNLVLLVACAAGFVSAWEALPNIPAHRRAEYFLLHGDGAYKFGYDTGDGSSHMAQADPANEVRGTYAYQGPSGPIQLAYTAGIGGFVPNLQEAQSGGVAVEAYSSKSGHSSHAHVSGGHSGVATGAVNSAVSQGQVDAYHDENADASYAFNIDTDEYKRQEASDNKGNVKGRYSYHGKDGNKVAVTYSAGAGTGFVIESQEGLDSASGQVSSYNAAVPASPPAIPYHAAPKPKFSAPVPAPAIIKPYSGPLADITSTGPFLDGSYSFSYETPELDRRESADANGIVQGRYSFVAGDGVRRTVDYRAGSLLGYIPQGDGINPVPIVPVVPSGGAVVSAYSNNAASSASHSSSFQAQSSHSGYAANAHSASSNEESNEPADASYDFEYQADDHSRKESSDAAGNVEGVYSFVDPEGVSRTVQYVAGANKGFVVKESAEAGVARAPAARPTVKSSGSLSTTAIHSGSASHSTSSGYSANIASQHSASNQAAVAPMDASYSFSYDAGDHAHQQNADPSGFVRGHYNFVADDGVSRSVQFRAGAGIGFVATGSHLPTAEGAALATQASAQPDWSSRATAVRAPIPVPAVRAPTAPAIRRPIPAPLPVVRTPALEEESGDASYSYSYQTDSSSKTETSDAQGNVVGTFTFIGGDGQSRTLNYNAGPKNGFLAKGAHLPVAPEAGAASAGGYSAAGASGLASAHVAGSNVRGSSISGSSGSWGSKTISSGSSVKTSGPETGANFVIHKYLPPDSSHKYGYIFDTRA